MFRANMPLIVRLYLNTALSSTLLCVLLAAWGAYNAVGNRAFTPTYVGALALNQVIVFVLSGWYVSLRLTGYMGHRSLLPVVYYLVALAVLPCVRLYVWEQSLRTKASSIALACLFTGGMVIRALQSGIVPH